MDANTLRDTTTKLLAATIAALLVVGGLALAVPDRSGDDVEVLDALLTAAERTAEVGSADVTVRGEAAATVRFAGLARMSIDLPDVGAVLDSFDDLVGDGGPSVDGSAERDPRSEPTAERRPAGTDAGIFSGFEFPEVDCAELPAEYCEQIERVRQQVIERLHGARRSGGDPRISGSGDDTVDVTPSGPVAEDLRQRLADERERARQTLERHAAAAQLEFDALIAEVPKEIHCRSSFEASGTMTLPGSLELDGDARVECDPDFVDGSGHFNVAVRHGLGLPFDGEGLSPAGRFGSILADGDAIGHVLRHATHDDTRLRDHGTTEIDGVTVRHLSFETSTDEGALGVDVWIGEEDHVVRKLVISSSGEMLGEHVEAEWATEQTLLLTNVEAHRS